MSGRLFRLAVSAALSITLAAPALAAEPVQIDELVAATTVPRSQRDAAVEAARAFYGFWNSGDEVQLKRAIAPSFTDHTLPPGRPQGPGGPAFASHQFRAAVPDLAVRVEKMIVAGDYVTVHMKFTGHFTGTFGQTQGKGQEIAFIATDLVKVGHGRITDNWHIEDNLTLLEVSSRFVIFCTPPLSSKDSDGRFDADASIAGPPKLPPYGGAENSEQLQGWRNARP